MKLLNFIHGEYYLPLNCICSPFFSALTMCDFNSHFYLFLNMGKHILSSLHMFTDFSVSIYKHPSIKLPGFCSSSDLFSTLIFEQFTLYSSSHVTHKQHIDSLIYFFYNFTPNIIHIHTKIRWLHN